MAPKDDPDLSLSIGTGFSKAAGYGEVRFLALFLELDETQEPPRGVDRSRPTYCIPFDSRPHLEASEPYSKHTFNESTGPNDLS